MIVRKKLIEVDLPLDEINAESKREKSIRHGHPSTLHLWWARRPLAACRAVIFAAWWMTHPLALTNSPQMKSNSPNAPGFTTSSARSSSGRAPTRGNPHQGRLRMKPDMRLLVPLLAPAERPRPTRTGQPMCYVT